MALLLLISISGPALFNQSPQAQIKAVGLQTIQQNGINECIITLASGRTITGELIKQNSQIVIVSIKGIETTFQRSSISSVRVLAPVAERFAQMRATIEDDDIDARLSLVEWLRNRRAYGLAVKELESVLIEEPHNPRAKLLYTWLSAYDDMGTPTKSSKKNTKPGDTKTTKESRAARKATKTNIPRLTPEQINLIRVYEIDLRNPPKLKVPDATLKALMLSKPDAFSPDEDERNEIYSLSEIEKLKIIFTHKARHLYGQVQILENPTSMEMFKAKVHAQQGWIINACATARCHGGPNAGRFQLINTKANSDETLYTNFNILNSFKLNDGSPLINYESPEHSPLVQMGMVEKNTLTPHPKLPRDYPGRGFRPIFRSSRDRKYRDAIEWIRSMYQPRPDYGFLTETQPEPKPDSTDPNHPEP